MNDEKNGAPVTDGEFVYPKYQWRDGKIFSLYRNRFATPTIIRGTVNYSLTVGKRRNIRSYNQLYAHSFPQEFVPQNYKNWIDVFGYEKYYCFNPDNPNQVWSKTRMKMIKLSKNNNRHSQHLLFCAYDGTKMKTYYIHKMVWQSYYKKTIKKGYVIHHLNHDCYDNRIQNMILLPRKIHSAFEVLYAVYKNASNYFINGLSKEQFIEKIENFDIDDDAQQKLINSL